MHMQNKYYHISVYTRFLTHVNIVGGATSEFQFPSIILSQNSLCKT